MDSQYPPFDMTAPSREAVATLLGLPSSSSGPHADGRGMADSRPARADLACELWRQAVHDLRGKLGVVVNVTALLKKTDNDGQRAELLDTLDRNVAGLRDLLDGVADLARLDAQQESADIREVDIARMLGETCDNLQALARSRGLLLEFNGPVGLIVQSDPLMVARMAQNLLLNAIQYTRAGGVVLTCGPCDATQPGRWYFDVGDAGAGTAANDQATPSRTSGEGIGLSIVGRLCNLLGGTMEVKCAGGSGRTTRIRLPMRDLGTSGQACHALNLILCCQPTAASH